MAEWAFYVRVVGEVATDSGDQLTFNLTGKDAQASPAPVVYIDGVEQTTGYTFNNGDQSTNCSITFTSTQTGEIKANYRWKYECADGAEDASIYEIAKEVNVMRSKDANGRTLISKSYEIVGNWIGIVRWEYATMAFFNMWRTIVESGYAFDLERTSDGDEPRTISNLMALDYPRFVELPDVPDKIDVGIEFVAL